MDFELRTARLVVRGWRLADRVPFAEMNADAIVMEFFPGVLARAASDTLVDRFEAEFAEFGFCPWAVELAGTGAFIGFVGLTTVRSELPFAPAVEIGWRLALPFWGRGYATEAGNAVLRYGFDEIGLEEIVSFTSTVNERSRRVMERLGMSRDPTEDFDHPRIAEDSAQCPHVLYRMRRYRPEKPSLIIH
jgi:RimJ/RimL family protein N-acetyltransferase